MMKTKLLFFLLSLAFSSNGFSSVEDFFRAVKENDEGTLTRMLSGDFDVDSRFEGEGVTALMMVASRANLPMVDFLMKRDASTELTSNGRVYPGKSALDIAQILVQESEGEDKKAYEAVVRRLKGRVLISLLAAGSQSPLIRRYEVDLSCTARALMDLFQREFDDPNGRFVRGLEGFEFEEKSELSIYSRDPHGRLILKVIGKDETLLESGVKEGSELLYVHKNIRLGEFTSMVVVFVIRGKDFCPIVKVDLTKIFSFRMFEETVYSSLEKSRHALRLAPERPYQFYSVTPFAHRTRIQRPLKSKKDFLKVRGTLLKINMYHNSDSRAKPTTIY